MTFRYLDKDGALSFWTNIKNYILSKIPTKTSELTNDSGFLTSHQSLSNYVTLNSTQTISGAKTFTADTYAPTPSSLDNSTKIATTAFVYNNTAKHLAVTTNIYVAKVATGNGSGSNTSNYMALADLRIYLATVHMHSSTSNMNGSYNLQILFKAGDSFGDATFDATKMPGVRNLILNTSAGTNSTVNNYSTNSPTFGNITVTGDISVTMRNLNCTGRISSQYGAYVNIDTYMGISSLQATNYGYLNVTKNMVINVCDAHTDYLFSAVNNGILSMWPGATVTINFRQQCYYTRALFYTSSNGTAWIGYSSFKLTGTEPMAVWGGWGTLTGTSTTAAATVEKAVTLASGQTFTLKTNATAKVKFTVDNTANNPTLNIGGTGAKPIYWNNAPVQATMLMKNITYDVKYNGSQFVIQNAVKRLTNNDFGVFRSSGNYNQTYNSGSWNFTGWALYYGTGIENSNWRGNHIGNIQQNVTTHPNTFPVLISGTANATANTLTVPYFAKGVKINPSTNVVSASGFDGPLTWSSTAFSYIAGNSLYYYSGQPAIANCFEGSSNDFTKFSYPTGGTSATSSNANIQTLRLDWNNGYWHDLFMSPNNDYLWHRNVVNSNARGWRRIVEENVTGLTDQSWNINIAGTATNVTGTVAIANGGTGATTRLDAVKNLTNEAVGTPTHFLAITTNWGKAGYTTVAQAKTVLGITGDMGSHSDSEYVHKAGNETISGDKTFGNGTLIVDNGTENNVHGEIKLNGTRPVYINADNSEDGLFANTACGMSILLNDASKSIHIGGVTTGNNGRKIIKTSEKVPYLTLGTQEVGTQILVPENDTADSTFSITSTLNYASGASAKSFTVKFKQGDDGSSGVFPVANNKTDLGLSGNRWKNVYATNYYYGANAVEFSTKFVTSDTNQTISGAKIFSSTITGDISGNASTATEFSATKDVTLTGDVTGTASSKAGWSVSTTLSNSGVTAGTYGPSADVTGNNNATISVPEITVDSKGRVTSVTNRTLTCKNNIYNVYNKTLTIQKNGTNVATFTSNSNTDVTANITVPTKTSQLTNDSNFLTTSSSLNASKLTGTIDIARLPQGALERVITVANQTARFALTTSSVQLGDTVKQLDTGVMYVVVNESKLNSNDGYLEYTAGSASSVPWSGITSKPTEFTPSSHTHTKSEITDFPTNVSAFTNDSGYLTSHQSLSNYVTLNTAQEITNTKTFKDAITVRKLTSVEAGNVLPSSDKLISDIWQDKNGKELGRIYYSKTKGGNTALIMRAGDWFSESEGVYSLNASGTNRRAELQLYTDSSGNCCIKPNGLFSTHIKPLDSSVYLGDSTKPFGRVYANSFQFCNASLLPNTDVQATEEHSVGFFGKNNSPLSYITFQKRPNLKDRVAIRIQTASNSYKSYDFDATCFYPESNNSVDIGSTTNIFKNIYCNNYYKGTTAFGDIVTHNASEFLTEHQSLANYVTTNTDQSISGTKTFGNGTLIVDNGTGSNVHGEIKLNGSRPGYIVADNASDGVFDNAGCGVSILLQDTGKPLHIGAYKTDSNGRVFVDNTNKKPVLSLTSSLIKTSILVPENDTNNVVFRILSELNYANGNPSKTLDVRFVQYDNATSAVYSNDDNKTSLGLSSKRWSSVHATNFYENGTALSDKYLTVSAISGGASTSAGNITPVKGTIISGFADSSSVTYSTSFGAVLVTPTYLYYATCVFNSSNSTMEYFRGPSVGGTGTWKLMGGCVQNPGSNSKLLFGLWIKIV